METVEFSDDESWLCLHVMDKSPEGKTQTSRRLWYRIACGAVLGSGILLGCVFHNAAQAASTTLLMFGDLRQNVSLGYSFQHQRSENKSHSEHEFDENYGFSFQYALINPRIVKGGVSASLNLGQSFNDYNGQNLRLNYEVDGRILERSRHPAFYHLYSQRSRVARDFAPTYDEVNEGYSCSLKLNNATLPASLNYHHNSTETSGLVADRRHETDNMHVSVSNTIDDYSHTSASYRFSRFRGHSGAGNTTETNAVNVHVANTVSADKGTIRRNLRSRYSHRLSSGGDNLKERRLHESLTWGLGKALVVGGGYQRGWQSTNDWETNSQSGNAYITHHLYQSLSTRLSGFASDTEYRQGYSQSSGGRVGLNYNKILPRDSRMRIDSRYSYSEIENNLEDLSLLVQGETHVVPELPDREIVLDHFDIERGSIVVYNADRTVRYRGGLDFFVEQEGRLTRIVFPLSPPPSPEPIEPGKELSIDYSYIDNPDLRYALRVFALSGNLSLFSSRHTLSAGYTSSSQDLLEGQAEAVALTDTKSYYLNYRRSVDQHTFGAGANYADTSASDRLGLTSFYRYYRRFYGGSWSILLKEQYWRYKTSAGSNNDEGWRNSFNTVVDYRRMFLDAFDTSVRGNYLYQRWEESSHNFDLHAETRFSFGLTQVLVLARLSWDRSRGNDTYSEYFGLRLTRSF